MDLIDEIKKNIRNLAPANENLTDFLKNRGEILLAYLFGKYIREYQESVSGKQFSKRGNADEFLK